MRSPALISTSSKAGCYAVLASLSGRYPPLEGRSPTCYSPVCHSTNPLRGFRVRLACVRHAASVDSEPGSNSHVKFAGCHRQPRRAALRQHNSLTRGRFGFCVVSIRSSIGGSSPVAFARTDNSGRPLPRRHPLTLIVRLRLGGLRRLSAVVTGLCVLARLSSFQRTDGSAPRAPYPTSQSRDVRRSHRPGPAWKASPPVGRGAFRGTF